MRALRIVMMATLLMVIAARTTARRGYAEIALFGLLLLEGLRSVTMAIISIMILV